MLKQNKITVSSIVLLLLGLIFMLPVFILVMNAFKPYDEIIKSFVTLPKSFYLGNFVQAAALMNYGVALKNSLIITVFTVIFGILVSFSAAFGISHIKGKKGNLIYLLFTLGQIIPFHTIMIPLSVTVTKLNMNNNLLTLILIYCGFHCAFGIFTYVGFLRTVPKSLEEAATIDGCSVNGILWKIFFPLVAPTTMTIFVLFFLWTWNDFLMPSIMLSDKNLRPITVNMYIFRGSTQSDWNLFIAALVLSIIPIIIVYLFTQKYITSGITAGAVKQ